MIYIKESSIHSYGVFASEDIPKDTLIDTSISIIFKNREVDDYKFKDNRIVFSKCSLVNSGIANIKTEHIGRVTNFYSIKDIKKDEELLLKYGGYNA